ncbi:MAG: hypothetical protein J6T96_05320 [Bacteroidales bacterium]|nr:hypothetical protein [Bacteroidales bacterium]
MYTVNTVLYLDGENYNRFEAPVINCDNILDGRAVFDKNLIYAVKSKGYYGVNPFYVDIIIECCGEYMDSDSAWCVVDTDHNTIEYEL